MRYVVVAATIAVAIWTVLGAPAPHSTPLVVAKSVSGPKPWRLARAVPAAESCGMLDRIRIIPHEAVPRCGSYEVRFPDGRPSRFYYWDDIAGRRLAA